MNMEEIKDWKGSVIQEGDTVLKVRVKNMDAGMSFCLIEIEVGSGKPFKQITEKIKVPERDIWEIAEEIFIKPMTGKDDNMVVMSFMKPYVETTLLCADMHLSCNHNEILCIKGKSDSEEEYYLEKFKV